MISSRTIRFKAFLIFFLFLSFIFFACSPDNNRPVKKAIESRDIPIAIVIHGGAGEIRKGFLSESEEEKYRDKLKEALSFGYSILENGGSASEAVVETIKILENSPLFNAAKGSVLTHKRRVSMDASIMRGKDINAGAVTGLEHIKNPIELARLVMDSSDHVFLSGKGAEEFATLYHLEKMENSYFITPRRKAQLDKKLGDDQKGKNHGMSLPGDKHGTVGCVAIDKNQNIAAGTSTGGMVNKRYGRIGDSPMIGAGTYANNLTCGISATGHGEYFIRLSVAKTISDLMNYKQLSLQEACKIVIQDQLSELGGTGGVIAIDHFGNYHFEFNTPGMYRAVKSEKGVEEISFYEKR